MLVCVFFACFARETAGAARIRHFLLPLLSRDDDTQTSGASRRENVDVYLLFEIRIETLDPSLRGVLATKQSILLVSAKLDCFASLAMTLIGARNDVDRLSRMPRHHPSLPNIAHQRHAAT
jgi:hypothetical protein